MPAPKAPPFLVRAREAWAIISFIFVLIIAGVSWTGYLQAEIQKELAEERRYADVQAESLRQGTYPATKGTVLEQEIKHNRETVDRIYNKLEEMDTRQRKMQSTLEVLNDRARK